MMAAGHGFLYSIVPLVIYAFLHLVGSGDCQKISVGECITCGVYCEGFKQVYGEYMSRFVELNSNCCGMRYGSSLGSSFVVGVLVNSIKPEVNEQLMDGVSYEYEVHFRFKELFMFKEYYAMCGHILTKLESVRFDKHEHPQICIQTHGILRWEYRTKRFLRSRCIYSSNGTATYNPSVISLILIRCGDIETQPGPISSQKSTTTKKPKCPECLRTIAKNHKTLYCTECTRYFHVKCVGLNTNNRSCQWICYSCALPNFSDSFFDDSVHSPIHLDVPNEEIG